MNIIGDKPYPAPSPSIRDWIGGMVWVHFRDSDVPFPAHCYLRGVDDLGVMLSTTSDPDRGYDFYPWQGIRRVTR